MGNFFSSSDINDINIDNNDKIKNIEAMDNKLFQQFIGKYVTVKINPDRQYIHQYYTRVTHTGNITAHIFNDTNKLHNTHFITSYLNTKKHKVFNESKKHIQDIKHYKIEKKHSCWIFNTYEIYELHIVIDNKAIILKGNTPFNVFNDYNNIASNTPVNYTDLYEEYANIDNNYI